MTKKYRFSSATWDMAQGKPSLPSLGRQQTELLPPASPSPHACGGGGCVCVWCAVPLRRRGWPPPRCPLPNCPCRPRGRVSPETRRDACTTGCGSTGLGTSRCLGERAVKLFYLNVCGVLWRAGTETIQMARARKCNRWPPGTWGGPALHPTHGSSPKWGLTHARMGVSRDLCAGQNLEDSSVQELAGAVSGFSLHKTGTQRRSEKPADLLSSYRSP